MEALGRDLWDGTGCGRRSEGINTRSRKKPRIEVLYGCME